MYQAEGTNLDSLTAQTRRFESGKRRKTEKYYFWFIMQVDKDRWPDPRLNLAVIRWHSL
jgi:hypothetical protein